MVRVQGNQQKTAKYSRASYSREGAIATHRPERTWKRSCGFQQRDIYNMGDLTGRKLEE